jgi:hypothetical protein
MTAEDRGLVGRRALGRALYAAPGRLRAVLPRPVREAVRRRTGPFAPWEDGFDHRPPPPEPGTAPAAPDFVGIGVQKAGTTWWFELLSAHPQVQNRPGVHKERHFFGRFATVPYTPRDTADYHGWFARPPGQAAGEWTPDYIAQPWVAPLLTQAAPDARVLVVLRHPVDRFLSGVAHARRGTGTHGGDVLAEAAARGLYASALEQWSAFVPVERLLVLQYEQCLADPAQALARTYRFLGLDDAFVPPQLRAPRSPTREPKPDLSPDARRRLLDLYAPDVERLAKLLPDLDLDLWPDLR